MDDGEDITTGNPSTFLNLDRSSGDGNNGISPLEQDVLDEYARLAKNMKMVRTVLRSSASTFDRALHRVLIRQLAS